MSEKRKIRKVPLFVDIEFNNPIFPDEITQVVQKIALALNNAIDSGNGLSPTDNNGLNMTSVNKVRIMCKDVVLLTEDHTQMTTDGGRVIEIQDIEGVVVKDQNEEKLESAVEILRNILCESSMDCEYDEEIYNFLKENNELPENYKPYWEDHEDE